MLLSDAEKFYLAGIEVAGLTSSNTQKIPLVLLTVLSGPDAGLSLTFNKERVRLGRDGANDFVLSDGFVSNMHGEFVFNNPGFEYRDLKSRHGSLVIVNNVSTQLNDRNRIGVVSITDGTELQIGSSIIRFELPESGKTLPPVSSNTANDTNFEIDAVPANEKLITTAHEPVRALTRRFEKQDVRLGLLFRLAEQLNALTRLEDVLSLIVDSTFEAFPSATFFSITLLDTESQELQQNPYLIRLRDGEVTGSNKPILSKSILNRVVATKESILWVRDGMGGDVTQSILEAQITACLCAPLVGQRRLLGVMQVDTRGRGALFSQQDLELFSVLASNAAFAFERAELTDSIVNMFESFVDASVTAIEARDPTTAGHSHRVSAYTLALASVVHDLKEGPFKDIRFSTEQMTELRYGTLLHDFGKITVPVEVLQKATRLPEIHLDVLAQRFETMKALNAKTIWHEFAMKVRNGAAQPDATTMAECQARIDDYDSKLDQTFDYLTQLNHKGFLPDEDIEQVRRVGTMTWTDGNGVQVPVLTPHEIENLTIRKGTLNDAEWEVMKGHSAQSQRFLERIPWGEDLKLIPYLGGAHHEKLDGSGYPLGIGADQLNIQVRMLTIADIFDALTAADRPYRKAATVERAVSILHMEADEAKLDKELVNVFEKHVVPSILHLIPSYQKQHDD